jgi:hypothetical protein
MTSNLNMTVALATANIIATTVPTFSVVCFVFVFVHLLHSHFSQCFDHREVGLGHLRIIQIATTVISLSLVRYEYKNNGNSIALIALFACSIVLTFYWRQGWMKTSFWLLDANPT